MSKRKRVRLAKWEQTTKAISVSLTLMQLGNMSMPITMNYASAAETLITQEQTPAQSSSNTVNNSVYAMNDRDATPPTLDFNYSPYSGAWLRFSEGVHPYGGVLEVKDESIGGQVVLHMEAYQGHITTEQGILQGVSGRSPWSDPNWSDLYRLYLPDLNPNHLYSLHVSSGMFRDM